MVVYDLVPRVYDEEVLVCHKWARAIGCQIHRFQNFVFDRGFDGLFLEGGGLGAGVVATACQVVERAGTAVHAVGEVECDDTGKDAFQ